MKEGKRRGRKKWRGILMDGAKPSSDMLNLVREWCVILQHPPCGKLWMNRILSSFHVYGLGGCARRQYRAKLYFAGMLVLREVTPLSNSNPFLDLIKRDKRLRPVEEEPSKKTRTKRRTKRSVPTSTGVRPVEGSTKARTR